MRLVAAALFVAAFVLGVAAAVTSMDNPTIDGTSRGDAYSCAAPYDTALNGETNYPGGEPPADADEIAERCRKAGTDRFVKASFVGAVGLVALGASGGLAAGAGTSAPRPYDRRA